MLSRAGFWLLPVCFALLSPAKAVEPEDSPNILVRISSLAQNVAKPVGVEFFVDYYGVFQGNPVGG